MCAPQNLIHPKEYFITLNFWSSCSCRAERFSAKLINIIRETKMCQPTAVLSKDYEWFYFVIPSRRKITIMLCGRWAHIFNQTDLWSNYLFAFICSTTHLNKLFYSSGPYTWNWNNTYLIDWCEDTMRKCLTC